MLQLQQHRTTNQLNARRGRHRRPAATVAARRPAAAGRGRGSGAADAARPRAGPALAGPRLGRHGGRAPRTIRCRSPTRPAGSRPRQRRAAPERVTVGDDSYLMLTVPAVRRRRRPGRRRSGRGPPDAGPAGAAAGGRLRGRHRRRRAARPGGGPGRAASRCERLTEAVEEVAATTGPEPPDRGDRRRRDRPAGPLGEHHAGRHRHRPPRPARPGRGRRARAADPADQHPDQRRAAARRGAASGAGPPAAARGAGQAARATWTRRSASWPRSPPSWSSWPARRPPASRCEAVDLADVVDAPRSPGCGSAPPPSRSTADLTPVTVRRPARRAGADGRQRAGQRREVEPARRRRSGPCWLADGPDRCRLDRHRRRPRHRRGRPAARLRPLLPGAGRPVDARLRAGPGDRGADRRPARRHGHRRPDTSRTAPSSPSGCRVPRRWSKMRNL